MKKINKELLKVVKTITEGEVKRTVEGWPPGCSGLLHQPKRPKSKKKVN